MARHRWPYHWKKFRGRNILILRYFLLNIVPFALIHDNLAILQTNVWLQILAKWMPIFEKMLIFAIVSFLLNDKIQRQTTLQIYDYTLIMVFEFYCQYPYFILYNYISWDIPFESQLMMITSAVLTKIIEVWWEVFSTGWAARQQLMTKIVYTRVPWTLWCCVNFLVASFITARYPAYLI